MRSVSGMKVDASATCPRTHGAMHVKLNDPVLLFKLMHATQGVSIVSVNMTSCRDTQDRAWADVSTADMRFINQKNNAIISVMLVWYGEQVPTCALSTASVAT